MDLTKANDFRFENGVSLSPLRIPKGKALYSFEEVNRLMESYHQYELKKLRVADVSGRSERFNAPYLLFRTKLTKVHKLSATTKPLLLHRCCYKPFLFRLLWRKMFQK